MVLELVYILRFRTGNRWSFFLTFWVLKYPPKNVLNSEFQMERIQMWPAEVTPTRTQTEWVLHGPA